MFFVDRLILIGAVLLLLGIVSSKFSARFGVPVLALFFVTVGMGIDPALVLLFRLCRLFGLPTGLAAGVSLTLAHGRARDAGHNDSLARAGATRVVPEVVGRESAAGRNGTGAAGRG